MAHSGNTKSNTYLNGFKFHTLFTSQKGASFRGAVWESEQGHGVGLVPIENSIHYVILVPEGETPFTSDELANEMRHCIKEGIDLFTTQGVHSFMRVLDECVIDEALVGVLLNNAYLSETDFEILDSSVDALKHHYLDLVVS